MLKDTGDYDVVWGIAQSRDPNSGILMDVEVGMSEEQARSLYDNFQANALLKFAIEVVSTYDGNIEGVFNYEDRKD